MGSNYIPLYVFLGLLLGFGVILPFFIDPFIVSNEFNPDSLITPFAEFISNGLNFTIPALGTVSLDFFAWLPDVAEEYLDYYFLIFTYIPNFLAVPLITIMIVSLSYTIIKLFWGT